MITTLSHLNLKMEIKNINQEAKYAENIPSVFVNYELLNFEPPQASHKVYEIDGKTYTEYLDENEGYEEFKLHAERIDVNGNETPPKKLQFEIQVVDNGYIINSTIFLDTYHYNTIVNNGGLHCHICDDVVLEENTDSHVADDIHKKNLEACALVEEHQLEIFRLIKDHYHCGICNELCHENTCSIHISGQTHMNNKIFASQKAAEIIIKRNALSRNNNNDMKHKNRETKNENNDMKNENNDTKNENYSTKNNNNDTKNNSNDTKNKNNDVAINESRNRYENLVLESCVSVKTEKKVFEIPYYTWNMISISKSKDNTFHCMACKIKESKNTLREHIADAKHKNNLGMFAINDTYENHLIREDDKWCHCSTCNNLHYLGSTELHIMKHEIGKPSLKSSKTIANIENKNNDTPSTSHSWKEIDFEDEYTTESENNDIATALSHAKCFVYLFGFQIQVSLLSLNVIFHYKMNFYCGLCKTVFVYQYLLDHMKSIMHSIYLQSTPAIQLYGYNYIRSIYNQPHCGICHRIILPEMLWHHLQDRDHIMQTNIALGIVNILPAPPQVARFAPNIKLYDQKQTYERKNITCTKGIENGTSETKKKIEETKISKETIEKTKNIDNMKSTGISDAKETIETSKNIDDMKITGISETKETIEKTKNLIDDMNNAGISEKKEIIKETKNIVDDMKNTGISETKERIENTKNIVIVMKNTAIIEIIEKTKNIVDDIKNTGINETKKRIEETKNIDDMNNTGITETKETIEETKNIDVMKNYGNSETKERIGKTKDDMKNTGISETKERIEETKNIVHDMKNIGIIETKESIEEIKNVVDDMNNNGISETKERIEETNNIVDDMKNKINETKNEIDETKNKINVITNTTIESENTRNETENTIKGPKNTINETKKAIDESNNAIYETRNDENNTIEITNSLDETINEVTVNNNDKKTNLCTELNKSVIHEINDDNKIFDAEVEILTTTSRMLISSMAFHTLVPFGDGDRYCFACGASVEGDMLENHISSNDHTEMIYNIKFLETYDNNLIRQNKTVYHCGLCNTIIRQPELSNHLKWKSHEEQRNKANNNDKTKQQPETVVFQKTIFSTQIEDKFNSGICKDIQMKGCYVIKSKEKNQTVPNNEIKKNKRIIINDLNFEFVLTWEAWHSIIGNEKKSCIVCNEKMDDVNLDIHINSGSHKSNLEKPFLKEYFPALIREINAHLWHCLICNTALYVKSALFAHIYGKNNTHRTKYGNILRTSLKIRPEKVFSYDVEIV